MSESKPDQEISNDQHQPAKAQSFSFDSASTMIDKSEILNYSSVSFNGEYYVPPINPKVFEKAYKENPYLGSAVQIKRNLLRRYFKPNSKLTRAEFSGFALDFLVMGDAYLERIDTRAGKISRLKRSPAMWTRRAKDDEYLFLTKPKGYYSYHTGNHHFKKGDVCHVLEEDLSQEIYGQPDFVPALNSAWLNRDATLFRRKYYLNGSHAGFILYMTDTAHKEDDIENLKEQLANSRGPGNFRNLLMYAPNGDKDGLKIIPISEVAAKDELLNVKNITAKDVIAISRVPPELMGTTPEGAALGDRKKALDVLIEAEIMPLAQKFEEVNEYIGETIIAFDFPKLSDI